MPLRTLKSHLAQMDKSDIIKLISEMYKKVPAAKDYLDLIAGVDVDNLVDKYKKKIERFVLPTSSGVMRASEARRLIREASKMRIPELNAELELFYVECCIHVISSYGLYDSSYYSTVYTAFSNATKNVSKAGMHDVYEERLYDAINTASEYGIELVY